MSKNMRSLLLLIVYALLGLAIAEGFIFLIPLVLRDVTIIGLCFGLMVGIVNVSLLNKEDSPQGDWIEIDE